MNVKTSPKAGSFINQHNETQAQGLTVRTGVKAGYQSGNAGNHNETQAQGLTVRTGVKAGFTYQRATAGRLAVRTGVKAGFLAC